MQKHTSITRVLQKQGNVVLNPMQRVIVWRLWMKKILFVIGELDYADHIAIAYLSASAKIAKGGLADLFVHFVKR